MTETGRYPKRTRIFFSILLAIIIFFIGINIGKYVEHINTKPQNQYSNPQIPKTKTTIISPTIMPTIAYTRYPFAQCGVSFVIPSSFHIDSDSKSSTIHANNVLAISCDTSYVTAKLSELTQQASTSSSAQLGTVQITQYSVQDSKARWTMRNKAGSRIYFEIDPSISQLIQDTLKIE